MHFCWWLSSDSLKKALKLEYTGSDSLKKALKLEGIWFLWYLEVIYIYIYTGKDIVYCDTSTAPVNSNIGPFCGLRTTFTFVTHHKKIGSPHIKKLSSSIVKTESLGAAGSIPALWSDHLGRGLCRSVCRVYAFFCIKLRGFKQKSIDLYICIQKKRKKRGLCQNDAFFVYEKCFSPSKRIHRVFCIDKTLAIFPPRRPVLYIRKCMRCIRFDGLKSYSNTSLYVNEGPFKQL